MVKTIKKVVALLLCLTSPSWATWTVVQQINAGGSAASCTLSPTSITAGNTIVVVYGISDSGLSTDTIASVTSTGDTWSAPGTSMYVQEGATGYTVDIWYLLSAAGGETSVTVSGNGDTVDTPVCFLYELHSSKGTAVYDTSGTRTDGSGSTHLGVSLTLSGTNDVIIQNIKGAAASIDTGYTDSYFGSFAGSAYLANTTNTTQPTWTGFVTTRAGMNAVAFKEFSAPTSKGTKQKKLLKLGEI